MTSQDVALPVTFVAESQVDRVRCQNAQRYQAFSFRSPCELNMDPENSPSRPLKFLY